MALLILAGTVTTGSNTLLQWAHRIMFLVYAFPLQVIYPVGTIVEDMPHYEPILHQSHNRCRDEDLYDNT